MIKEYKNTRLYWNADWVPCVPRVLFAITNLLFIFNLLFFYNARPLPILLNRRIQSLGYCRYNTPRFLNFRLVLGRSEHGYGEKNAPSGYFSKSTIESQHFTPSHLKKRETTKALLVTFTFFFSFSTLFLGFYSFLLLSLFFFLRNIIALKSTKFAVITVAISLIFNFIKVNSRISDF